MEHELESLTAFVTGGASGIGLATAHALSARGARVAVFDRVAGDALPEGALALVGDVTDTVAVDDAIATTVSTFGGLDIVVNNAGIPCRGLIEETTDDEWHHVLDVNVVGMARVIRAALPHLRQSTHAAIVNTCSVSASVGLERLPIYSASKGAVEALTRALAADLMSDGIRVNSVKPGTVDSPWMDRVFAAAADPQQALRDAAARQPMGRMVTSDEVAHAIAFLVGPHAASITGTELAIDGGMANLRLSGNRTPDPISEDTQP